MGLRRTKAARSPKQKHNQSVFAVFCSLQKMRVFLHQGKNTQRNTALNILELIT
jgi:hypothetical protein